MDTIVLELWSGKAWQEIQILRTIRGKDLREQGKYFRQTFTVPYWMAPVHGGSDGVALAGVFGTGFDQGCAEVLKDWIDTTRN